MWAPATSRRSVCRRMWWILSERIESRSIIAPAAGLVVQRSGLAAGLLNHNDICHVLQTAALWPFYRAGLLLRDQPHLSPPVEI